MKTIDQLLKELPEPDRITCLRARAKSKENYPDTYDDTQTAPNVAVAIRCGFYWGMGSSYNRFAAIYQRALNGEFMRDEKAIEYMRKIKITYIG